MNFNLVDHTCLMTIAGSRAYGIDHEEIVSIRAGAWSYDQLIDWAETKNAKLNKIYETKSYVVPHAVNHKAINKLCCKLINKSI